MRVWRLGMRMRIFADALWSLGLALVLLLQGEDRNTFIADRLKPQHWTPFMVACVLMVLAVLKLSAAIFDNVRVAAITEGAGFLVFGMLTFLVWPPAGGSFIFPMFTIYVAVSQLLSLTIIARDPGV